MNNTYVFLPESSNSKCEIKEERFGSTNCALSKAANIYLNEKILPTKMPDDSHCHW